MANRFIYVWSDDGYDRSRWLSISAMGPNELQLRLDDLCHPGQLSPVTRVSVESTYLRSVLDNGALQLTTPEGYLLLRRSGKTVLFEFRGRDESSANRVSILVEDIEARLDSVGTEPRASAI